MIIVTEFLMKKGDSYFIFRCPIVTNVTMAKTSIAQSLLKLRRHFCVLNT